MANEQRRQTGTNDPANRPNQPGQGQQNPGDRRSDDWADKSQNPKNPRPGQSDPSRRDDDDMEETEDPA
jgi:hypothetical protein